MKDKELLEYIAVQVGKLTQSVGDLRTGQTNVEVRLDKIESIVTRIENDH